MNYIVCSYGGSGSWMLVKYLSNFGKTFHIHCRYPPKKLRYPDLKTERFTKVEIGQDKLNNYKVIFIYKNPINAIFSRFNSVCHLRNIQSREMNYENIFKKKEDLFGIAEYYDNYVSKIDRNYPIYCVKYETFFENIEKFNDIIGITTITKLLPIKKETLRDYKIEEYKHLMSIYETLIKNMENNPPIFKS